MIIKTPFVERVSFEQNIYGGYAELTAYDTDGNTVYLRAIDKLSDECKVTYTVNNQYKGEENHDFRIASKSPADAVEILQEYAEYLFDFGYEKGIIIQPDVPVDNLAKLVEKRMMSLKYAGQSFRIRNFPERDVYTDFAYVGDGKCDVTIGTKNGDFAVCNELPIETIKEDVHAIRAETLPFNRIVGLGKTDPTPVKLSELIKQAKGKDEIYHIEGDTLIINDGVTVIDGRDFHIYDGNDEYLSIKQEFENIKKVIVPDSVVKIGYDAFYEFQNLEDISLPNSITNIGYDAFGRCTSLKNVTIPDSVTDIEDYAFFGCENLTSISIPNGVTSIEGWTFSECSSLTNVTIPDSVTSIDNCAFEECKSLTSITIPDSVTEISAGAFWDCYNLESIIIPDSVTNIGERAFIYCSSLESITIPDSVTNIGECTFNDCDNLTIRCSKGSYAEEYAKKDCIPVEYIKDKSKTIERE